MRGAAILAVAGLANRVVGAISRIILPAMIGDEGMGLFQMAYPIYSMFLVFSTAGVPVAVSKLVAEQAAKGNRRGTRYILRVATMILAFTGIFSTAVLFMTAGYLSRVVLKDTRAAYSIYATAPAVLILSVMSGFRGYFQGLQRMETSAASQIGEQLIRVFFMIGLAYILLPRGIEYSAAGAAFGAVAGGVAGFAILIAAYYRGGVPGIDGGEAVALTAGTGTGAGTGSGSGSEGVSPARVVDPYMRSSTALAVQVFSLSLPIVLGAAIMPLMQVVDAALVPVRLHAAGILGAEVTRLYGQLTGMALPLVYFPTVLTTALATSAVPAVSEAVAFQDRRLLLSRAQDIVWLGFLIGLPASLGLYLLADEFCMMFYRLPQAGVSLRALAFGTLFLCLQQTSSGVLQGLGAVSIPVKNLLKGAIVKAIVNYVLTGIPAIGIRGAALGTVAGFGLSSILNIIDLYKMLGLSLDVRDKVAKPVLATFVMGIAVIVVYDGVMRATGSNTLGALGATTAGAGVYGLTLLATGALHQKDIEMLPMGKRLARLLVRLKLIR